MPAPAEGRDPTSACFTNREAYTHGFCDKGVFARRRWWVWGVRLVVEFLVLGPIEVRSADGQIRVGGIKQRSILALLIANRGHAVSADRIVDEIYGEDAGGGVRRSVQSIVSLLRRERTGRSTPNSLRRGCSCPSSRVGIMAVPFGPCVHQARLSGDGSACRW
jgi:hypothetical protein